MTLASVTSPETPAKKPTTMGQKIGALAVIVVMGLCCYGAIGHFSGSGGKPAGGSTEPADRSDEAKWACEQFVKKQLKSPATAKFSEESATKAVKAVGDEYIASGSVDSQNSFGALLRSTFSCDITYDTAKQEWTSKSVVVV